MNRLTPARGVTRMEGFSDAVFGFAATLLVVSLEVPRSVPELVADLQGFLAFGLSFAALVLIWSVHHAFFRRFDIEEGTTLVINSVLLFVVLFYVYPLKFVAEVISGAVLGVGDRHVEIGSWGELGDALRALQRGLRGDLRLHRRALLPRVDAARAARPDAPRSARRRLARPELRGLRRRRARVGGDGARACRARVGRSGRRLRAARAALLGARAVEQPALRARRAAPVGPRSGDRQSRLTFLRLPRRPSFVVGRPLRLILLPMRSVQVLAACLVAAAAVLPARAQLAVRGDTVLTMSGAPIVDGVVLIGEDGRIREVGPASRVRIPAGWRVVRGRIVTPGLIDARSTVGLSGLYNQRQDQDQLDPGGPLQPELRALDAYNPLDTLVGWLRGFGITTVHTGHSAGALASGTTAIFKTTGLTADDAAVVPEAMIAMTIGEGISSVFPSPGTRAKGAAILRAEFVRAQAYLRRGQAAASGASTGGAMGDTARVETTRERLGESPSRPAAPAAGAASTGEATRDLRLDALGMLLRGERVALVTAHRASDIQTALRLQREFGFRMILDGGSEAYLVLDDLKRANVPVFVHPTMLRASGEAANVSMETAAALRAAGIPFAFTSGYEPYVPKTRVVLFEAAVAVGQGGLPRMAALDALTRGAARLLGIDARVGSLEAGKDADVVVWDGDPLEYTTHACTVVIGGRIVSSTCR